LVVVVKSFGEGDLQIDAERVLHAKLQCSNAELWILFFPHILFWYMAISSPYEFT